MSGDLAAAERGLRDARISSADHQCAGAFLFGFGATVALARAWVALDRREWAVAELRALRSAAQRPRWRKAEASAALVRARRRRDGACAGGRELAARPRPAGDRVGGARRARRPERSDVIVAHVAASVGDERLAAGFVRATQG